MTPDWDDAEDWDDDRNPDLDDCIHEDADVDILTGEMTCHRCGFHKYLTGDEIRREAEIQAEMMEAYHQEMLNEDAAIEKAKQI
jgi:hypothetical protein